MSIGGFLLGAFLGAVVAFTANTPFWLFGPRWYVLPALFGVTGAIVVRRLPGYRALSLTGYLVGALGLLAFGAFCWWVIYLLTHRHGWF